MSLLWIEGFDNFGSSVGSAPSPTGVVARKYPIISGETYIDIEDGRFGGYAAQLQEATTTCYMSPGALTTNATIIVGCAVKYKTAWDADAIICLYDGTTLGVNVYMGSDGELSVRRGSTVLGTTVGLGLSLGAWFYVELKVVCSDTGSYELRVGGVNVLSATGVDTKEGSNSYHTTFRLRGNGSSDTYAPVFDDLYCCDGAGSDNNDFLGNVRVTTLRPSAEGDSTDLTPSAGDNYAAVDEVIADDDTTYVESATSTHKDLYEYSDPSPDTMIVIYGVQVNTDCRETDAGSFSLKTVCLSGETESADAGQAIASGAYATRSRVIEQDPDTDAAWLEAGVAAAQFGLEVA